MVDAEKIGLKLEIENIDEITELGMELLSKITGSAYITGVNEWILDDDDSLEYGFLYENRK